jgi:hypothetical protein
MDIPYDTYESITARIDDTPMAPGMADVPRIPTQQSMAERAQAWQLYWHGRSDQKRTRAKVAAAALDIALQRALDLGDVRAGVEQLKAVMDAYRDVGASDTEPRAYAREWLVQRYGSKAVDASW